MNYTHSDKKLESKRRSLRKGATPQEIILWSKLRHKNLGVKFQRQHGIGSYIVDFYCPKKKLIIEIDGIQHDNINDKNYDSERTKYFESLGFKVLRFWNNEINTNMEGVLIKIESEIDKS